MKPNLSLDFCGIKLKNPIMTASGTCGHGLELSEFFPVEELGAVSVKGMTLAPREGNATPRIAETAAGMLNSVGLQNPGADHFIEHELPGLKAKGVTVIANISGDTIDDYAKLAAKLDAAGVDMIELNISCPNVSHGGLAFGTDADVVYELTKTVKSVTKVPIIVKLSPNVTDVVSIAKAAENGGADALSLINTLLGMKIDIKTRKPVLARKVGGFSGPAIKPVAVRMVWQVTGAVKIPVIGMGGIMTAEDVVEFLLAGAKAVMVGTATLIEPDAAYTILHDLEKYMEENGIEDIGEFKRVD